MDGRIDTDWTIKILFCTDGLFPLSVGGMQRHSRLLIEELATRENIGISVIHPHDETIFNNPKVREIRITPIDTNKNYLFQCYSYSKRIYEIICKHPDYIVYSQGLSVWYHIAKVKNLKVVNPHGLEPYQALGIRSRLQAIPFKLIFDYIFQHADKVISLGGKLTQILERRPGVFGKVVEIPNAVNIKSIEKTPKLKAIGTLKVLFVGRFAHNKGIDILFKVIDLLRTQTSSNDFDFTLVGKGPLLDFYRARNQYKNVNITGSLSDADIEELYRNSDVFVLPTLFEGMPTVVLEAMSFNLPIIVSDVGATAELVDQRNGILIPPGSVSNLFDALIKFRDLTPVQRADMGMASFNKVSSKFTWRRIADDHIHLMESLSHR